MRIRNGSDFLEATIRSHADMYDEIVAVYNQCTDDTADILAKLQAELGPKLRLFHYLPPVSPAGSDGHAKTPGDAPESLVTYSNFALSQTRYKWIVKLDDDHLCIRSSVQEIVNSIRNGKANEQQMHCFSGLNLMRTGIDEWKIPAEAPVSGKGDIGYFRMTENTYYVHDRRFERFVRGDMKRVFAGWFYWHLKYLKAGGGFANYNLNANPNSRYARRKARLQQGALLTLEEAKSALEPGALRQLRAMVDAKERLIVARDRSINTAFPMDNLTNALDATAPNWRHWLEVAK